MKPFIFDGAFGTYYHKKNSLHGPCEMANIKDQETVYKIHREYVEAGVDAVKTNTFGANRVNYADKSIRDAIIKNGYDLAVMVVKGTPAVPFADIGYIETDPDADINPDIGPSATLQENEKEEYRSIAEEFVHAGATRFLFETLAEYEPVQPAVAWIKRTCPDAFIVVTFAVSQDGYSRKGLYYKTLLKHAAADPDVDVCGLNCICGPSHLLPLFRTLDIKEKPVCAMPNSGYPATVNGRTVFQDNAVYFAEKLNELSMLGIRYLGGCCGTTPEHMGQAIRLIRAVSQSPDPGLPRKAASAAGQVAASANQAVRTNLFRDKLTAGKLVIAVELDSPHNADASSLLDAAKKVRDTGADIITLADSPLARTRADSILLASKIKREIGIDALPHLSCRDRNHIGLKAALLGASIENINNILVITGDPIAQTDRNEMKGVFSYNSFQLISFVKSLNEEVLPQSPIHIAAALNVNAPRFENELKRARNKIENGADLFLTQPLFSEESIQNAITAKKTLSAKILFGLMPVASYKNAMFLNNEVAGIQIPQDFVERLKDRTPQEVEALALEFILDIVHRTKSTADGFYLMAPLKKIDLVCALIKRIQGM